jgi:ATP-binding cassette subfamily C protein
MSADTHPAASTVEFVRFLVRTLRWRLAASLAAAVALAFAEGAGLLLLVPLLASVGLTVGEGAAARLAASIERAFALIGVTPSLPVVLGLFLAVSVAHALLYRTHTLLNPSLEQQVARAVRERLYRAIVSARWPLIARLRTTDLVHAVTVDVDRLASATYQLLTFTTGAVVLAVYVGVAARLSLALTSLVALSGLALLWLLRGRTRESTLRGEEYVESSRRLFSMASESVAGVKLAKSLGAERRDVAIFESLSAALSERYLDLMRSFARVKLGLDVASAVAVSVLLYLAVTVLHVRGAGLLLLVLVFARLMPRVMALQEAVQIFLGALPSFAAVQRTIAACEAEAEHGCDEPEPRLPLGSGVTLEHVSFAYESSQPVLSGVSMEIAAGSTTGIAGASGAGKSTVADLVMGLLRPTGGRVLVGGATLVDADVRRWRASIGYVPQDPFLLHDTVRANLLWARPDASEAGMWRALERAAAAPFLRARPEGLDTIVGDRGVRLSGGERQRLALARALLLEPELLVLDEATSALDAASERQILDAVGELAGSMTVLLITHRLSTLERANVVHVLGNGRVVESGSWRALADREGGAFRAMLDAQRRDERRHA